MTETFKEDIIDKKGYIMTDEQKMLALESGFPFLPEAKEVSLDTAMEAGFYIPTEE